MVAQLFPRLQVLHVSGCLQLTDARRMQAIAEHFPQLQRLNVT